MFKIDKTKKEDRLVRLHPAEGGKTIKYNMQSFRGVSVDLFVALDTMDSSAHYCITRKLNINIAVNPDNWTARSFFEHFTQGDSTEVNPFKSGALGETSKCKIHGDKKTGLLAHDNLLTLLQQID